MSDIIVLVATFALTVIFDLVVAIEVGMVITLILFMKRLADVTHVRSWSEADEESENDGGRLKNIPDKVSVYEINGPMFFADSDKFDSFPVKDGDRVMIVRMRNVPSIDISAMRSLDSLRIACKEDNIELLFSHVNEQSMKALKKSGFCDALGEEHFCEKIDEAITRAKLIIEKDEKEA